MTFMSDPIGCVPTITGPYLSFSSATFQPSLIASSISFIHTFSPAALARDLVRQLSNVQQEVPDWLSTIADGYVGGGGGGR